MNERFELSIRICNILRHDALISLLYLHDPPFLADLTLDLILQKHLLILWLHG